MVLTVNFPCLISKDHSAMFTSDATDTEKRLSACVAQQEETHPSAEPCGTVGTSAANRSDSAHSSDQLHSAINSAIQCRLHFFIVGRNRPVVTERNEGQL
jgi:hypothetical protein